jgi:hypothetical protein
MKLYHASNTIVANPDVLHSRPNLDFGAGFYATLIKQQALDYSERFKTSHNTAYLNKYDFDDAQLNNFKVLRFDTYSKEWLNFIASCRNGVDSSAWDIVIGGVANDRVFKTVEFYMTGDYTAEMALAKLIYEKPNHQICFRSQRAIDALLTFVEAEKLQ